jgi:cytochrome c nitrite reductase small subunit
MKLPVIIGLIALVVVLSVGIYVTDFPVYLGNDPSGCENCHVMDYVYEGWYHAGHQGAASCAECHAPHNLILKYLFKAKSGANDVWHFSTGTIPDPIRAKPLTDRIIQANCIRCHSETVSMIADGQKDAGRYCFDCHRSAGHGERGLTIMPHQDSLIYTP